MSLYPTPTASVGQLIIAPSATNIVLTPDMLGYNYVFTLTFTVNFDSTGLVNTPAGWYMTIKNANAAAFQVITCSENGSSMTAPLGPLGSALYGYVSAQNPIPVFLYWDGNHLMLF
jgi:hypothetical protein